MQARMMMPNKAEFSNVLGTTHATLVSGAESEGRFTVMIMEVPPGQGIPPHIHTREDELFYVLEGRAEIFSEGQWRTATAGSSFFGPRNIPHGLRCAGDSAARLMVTICPAGVDAMFVELAELPPGPPDLARVAGICARYGISFV